MYNIVSFHSCLSSCACKVTYSRCVSTTGFVPIARSLFGAALDGHSAPFVLGTEFPDHHYCTAKTTHFQKNFLVCGKLDLAQNRVMTLFDYSLSSTTGSAPLNLVSTVCLCVTIILIYIRVWRTIIYACRHVHE